MINTMEIRDIHEIYQTEILGEKKSEFDVVKRENGI